MESLGVDNEPQNRVFRELAKVMSINDIMSINAPHVPLEDLYTITTARLSRQRWDETELRELLEYAQLFRTVAMTILTLQESDAYGKYPGPIDSENEMAIEALDLRIPKDPVSAKNPELEDARIIKENVVVDAPEEEPNFIVSDDESVEVGESEDFSDDDVMDPDYVPQQNRYFFRTDKVNGF